VAAIATLMNGWMLMTTLWWWVRPLFLLSFFCFGLAVNCPRKDNLLRMSILKCKDGVCEKWSCECEK
jgi:hypothetical protein